MEETKLQKEAALAPALAGRMCERAAGHFAGLAAEAWQHGIQERAEAFEEAAEYFRPQMWTVGFDGELRFLKPSIGEKNWAERITETPDA